MNRRLFTPLLCVAALLGASVSQAVIVEYTWTGNGVDNSITTPGNWDGNVAPAFDGNQTLIFPAGRRDFVNIDGGAAHGLQVTGHYHLWGIESTFDLGAGGLTYSVGFPTHLVFEGYLAVNLTADQTWAVGPDARVEFYEGAFLYGPGKMTKTGAGVLDPNSTYYQNDWSGGVQFNEGAIVLRPGYNGMSWDYSLSLGTGPVTIGPDTTNRPVFLVADWPTSGYGQGDDVVLENEFVLNGVFNSRNQTELNLLGDVTLNADTTLRTAGDLTVFSGIISESSAGKKLTVDSTGAIILEGSSGWTGGTHVQQGVLIFAGEGSTPGTPNGILIDPLGYAGISINNNVGGFLGEVDPASTGTIGFDTDPESAPSDFTADINLADNDNIVENGLTPFAGTARLGTATHAILSGTITPQGSDYRFGGGGGVLAVASQLTGARNLVLDSPAELPLTVRLMNSTNNFSGTVNVANSGLVFGDNLAAETFNLPAGTYTMNAGSYIGSEDPDVTAATLLGHIAPASPGIVGLDIGPDVVTTRELANLSMAGYSSAYFGTSSAIRDVETYEVTGPGLRLTGTITADNGVHRFAAYKGGALEVAGTLTGNALIIGHPDSLGAFGDRTREEYSTVLVSADNGTGLAGGTTLYGGSLILGHNNALGSGTLTVAPVSFTLDEEDGPETPSPHLGTFGQDLTIANPIVLNAPELDVGGDDNFTLAGVISGAGELYVGEESAYGFTLTLSGANTYSGGTYVSDGAMIVANHNQALGTGPLGFGSSSEGGVVFTTAAPVIGGLDSYDFGYVGLQAENTVLTINQAEMGQFTGEIRSEAINQNMRLIKTGPGTLRLDGYQGESSSGFYGYGFNGTALGAETAVNLIVQQGALVLTPGFYVEDSSSTVWVQDGGTLALENYYTDNWGDPIAFSNPVVVDGGGRIAGHGNFASLTIGGGAILSPGAPEGARIGKLGVDHLELNSGGILEWHIRNIDAGTFAHDLVDVGLDALAATLVVNAGTTPDDPLTTGVNEDDRFTLKIISIGLAGLEGDVLANFDPSQSYAWTVFTYDALQGFDPAKFGFDLSAFGSSLAFNEQGDGQFALFDNGDGQILLAFTPVPEPSTYALMALGLGFIGLSVWRKRRA